MVGQADRAAGCAVSAKVCHPERTEGSFRLERFFVAPLLRMTRGVRRRNAFGGGTSGRRPLRGGDGWMDRPFVPRGGFGGDTSSAPSGHLPLKGKAYLGSRYIVAFPLRGRWHGEAVTDEVFPFVKENAVPCTWLPLRLKPARLRLGLGEDLVAAELGQDRFQVAVVLVAELDHPLFRRVRDLHPAAKQRH